MPVAAVAVQITYMAFLVVPVVPVVVVPVGQVLVVPGMPELMDLAAVAVRPFLKPEQIWVAVKVATGLSSSPTPGLHSRQSV